MKKIRLLVIMIGFVTIASAQSPVDSVKTAINQLFTAMKTSNAQLLRDSFADSGYLQTIITDKNGNTTVKNESIKDFAAFVATVPKGFADERISFDVVKTDASLAIAWTPYKFYRDGKFSHCGVNSFQMVRFNGVWKIQYLIDTRRKDPCE